MRNLFWLVFALLLCCACKDTGYNMEQEAQELSGEAVFYPDIFPDSLVISRLEYSRLIAAKHQMIIVVDAIKCFDCEMLNLLNWEERYYQYITSEVSFFAVIQSKNPAKVKEFLKVYKISIPVIIDCPAAFFRGIIFPSKFSRTFLVTDGVIRIAGSPLVNPALQKKYIKALTESPGD